MTVSYAVEISDVSPHTPADGSDLPVSPAVAHALHADAVRLKRGELLFVIPAAIVSLAAAAILAGGGVFTVARLLS